MDKRKNNELDLKNDPFYNVQLLLSFIFMGIVLCGVIKLFGMDGFDTLIGLGVVIILKIDVFRYEFRNFVNRLEYFEE